MSSPSSQPPPSQTPQPTSNTDPRTSHAPNQNQDQDQDQNHPDAPLPIEPYQDDPLREYEPRPIPADEEAEDSLAAAARPRKAWLAKLRVLWLRNKGMFLVLLAQMFGASMNVMTKVLEIRSSMHPFQVFPFQRL